MLPLQGAGVTRDIAIVAVVMCAVLASGLLAVIATVAPHPERPADPEPPPAPMPALPRAVPWYLEDQHPRVWEPVNRAETAEQPPWGAATRLDGTPLWQERSAP